MKTAEELILEFQELPFQEQQKVADYLYSWDHDFPIEQYSDEDTAKILKAGEDAENGIGVSPELEGDEAINFLRTLRKA